MSKSLGNFVTIRDVLKDWPGEVVRLNMLKTHYRQPIDWTVRGLEESERALKSWGEALEGHMLEDISFESSASEEAIAALRDDLNTPKMIAEIHGLAKAARSGDRNAALQLAGCVIWPAFDEPFG